MAAWKEVYPHFFEAGPVTPAGDFEVEAAED